MSPDIDSTHQLQGLIESSPDAIVIANPYTKEIVETNHAAGDLFGYTQEELRSMCILDLHPADERRRYERLFREHFETQPAVISQFDDGSPVFAATAEGEYIPVEINAWAIDIEKEDLDTPLFQGVFREISEKLRRRRELQQQNERFDEFATVVSHDLRNPLNVAQGRATLISQEYESEHLGPLQTALDRMETIIDNTLTLAQNGQRVGELEPVNVVNTIGDCWGTVDTSEATLEIADEFTIMADPDRLRHIYENLIRNSVEHGGDSVNVRVGRVGESTMYLEDDGPGIPEDERDDVLTPGYSSRSDGTGFGLAIVHRLAEAHGWTINLTESDTGGVRFEFKSVEIE
ncbi:MAG: PAS domain-containing sensor histidine kinase [Halobacteriota archaeon]